MLQRDLTLVFCPHLLEKMLKELALLTELVVYEHSCKLDCESYEAPNVYIVDLGVHIANFSSPGELTSSVHRQ